MTDRELQRVIDLGCPLHPGRDCATWTDHDPQVRALLDAAHELQRERAQGRKERDDRAMLAIWKLCEESTDNARTLDAIADILATTGR